MANKVLIIIECTHEQQLSITAINDKITNYKLVNTNCITSIFIEGTLRVMVIVIGTGIGNQNSSPG